MNAVIIYEDWEAGARAFTLLERAARRAEGRDPWSIQLWHLDRLGQTATARASLCQAVGAHLIILALQDQVVLPAELVNWLESWAGLRLLHDAAIAVFDGGEGDTLSATATPVISEFARRQGLSLILRDVHPSAARSAISGLEPVERDLPMLPVMHCDPDVPACSRYEVFGINE